MKQRLRKNEQTSQIPRRRGYRRRPAFVLLLAAVLMVSTCSAAVFAAGASDRPDASSYAVQTAAGEHGDTATVTLGKILTVSAPNRFPDVSDFIYSIEAVRAWDNANRDTAKSGESIAASAMPMPTERGTAHQTVAVSGSTATVHVGNFQNTSASNRAAGEGEDTALKRTRTTPVQIRFAKAGYYLYKVKELGSARGSGDDYAQVVRNVPGVDYDDNEYFMVFYVCNKVDRDGNTVSGVYVRSITSYANTSGSESYAPDLSDIQNVTDNGGTAAGANTGQANGDGTFSHTLGKVGVSDESTPNQLEAYRMWNAYTDHDVVLKKNVTGNLGDRSKLFEYTITLSGLGRIGVYTTDTKAQETGDVSTVQIDSVSVGTKLSGTSFRADADGNAVLKVRLCDDDALVLNGLPMTSQYQISEAASDHVAKYEISTSGGTSGDRAAVIAKAKDTNGTEAETRIETAVETVDRYDGTVTVQFINNRDLATITGVPGTDPMVYAAAVLLCLMGAGMLVRSRGRRRL